jgi:hypothetical protein
MHYKTNRLNHDFQIAYFLAGACHTPDAAYALLCDLRDDREDALKTVKASELRMKAKSVRARRKLESEDEAERLDGEADLAEIEATLSTGQKSIDAAQAELATILACIEKVHPLRKFSHLPDAEAHEAAQAEEWKLQLIHMAHNHMLVTGTVPADHFATMRMHPAFRSEMLPAITDMRKQIVQAQGDLSKINIPGPSYDIPFLK